MSWWVKWLKKDYCRWKQHNYSPSLWLFSGLKDMRSGGRGGGRWGRGLGRWSLGAFGAERWGTGLTEVEVWETGLTGAERWGTGLTGAERCGTALTGAGRCWIGLIGAGRLGTGFCDVMSNWTGTRGVFDGAEAILGPVGLLGGSLCLARDDKSENIQSLNLVLISI